MRYSVSLAQAVTLSTLSTRATQRNRFPSPRIVALPMSTTKWDAVEALPPLPKK